MQDATHRKCVLGWVNSSELSDVMVIYKLAEQMTWRLWKKGMKSRERGDLDLVPPGRC